MNHIICQAVVVQLCNKSPIDRDTISGVRELLGLSWSAMLSGFLLFEGWSVVEEIKPLGNTHQ